MPSRLSGAIKICIYNDVINLREKLGILRRNGSGVFIQILSSSAGHCHLGMDVFVKTANSEAFVPHDVTLTCKGMAFVNWDCTDDEFEFVFGSDRVCCVHSVLAEFLSPKIARIRRSDPCSSVYTFKPACPYVLRSFQRLISSLRQDGTLQVNRLNFADLFRISQELENQELLSALLDMIKPEFLTIEAAAIFLQASIEVGGAVFSDHVPRLTEFVASRFCEIGKEILKTLNLETAQLLLSNRSLKIDDEDSLYDFVMSRAGNDVRFMSLFEFIYFEYLSQSRIEEFASFASEHLLDIINAGVWSKICRRLIFGSEAKEWNPRVVNSMEFAYDSKPLDGIIAHLTRTCGGNVHDEGIVHVTASSFLTTGSQLFDPKNAVELEGTEIFASINEEGAWICYDFRKWQVIPKSYSLQSQGDGPGGLHPRSWVIEVSDDNLMWTEIDRRTNNNDLNGQNLTQNFKIANVPSESYRYIRMKQIGPNHAGNNQLVFSDFEIFGTLLKS